jgi:hypothetical protein
MNKSLSVRQLSSGLLEIHVPVPHTGYIDSLARKDCFQELWSLFRYATAPFKEMSESYSAYKHLKPWHKLEDITVIHIGDGAHCRTAALFALMSKHDNISIDPDIHVERVRDWQERHRIVRFSWFKGKWQDFDFSSLKGRKVLFTFVHAHVESWRVLLSAMTIGAGIDVLGAYVSACCLPGTQLTLPTESFDDWGILSPNRRCQVWGKPEVTR